MRVQMYDVATKRTATKEGAAMAALLSKHYSGVGDDKASREIKKRMEEARRNPQKLVARLQVRERNTPSMGVLGILPRPGAADA